MDIEDSVFDLGGGGKKNLVTLKCLPENELRTLNIYQGCLIIEVKDPELLNKVGTILSMGHTAEEKMRRISELPEIKAHLDSIDDEQHKEISKISNLETKIIHIPKLGRPAYPNRGNLDDVVGDLLVLGMCAMFVGNYQLAREFFVLIRNCSAVENVPLMHC